MLKLITVETDNFMTDAITYEKYENTIKILEFLNEFLHFKYNLNIIKFI